jgi:hypothetical protein
MKIAEVLDFRAARLLERSSLNILHKPAEWAPGFSKDLENGRIVDNLVRSHDTALAAKNPHQTATRPRKMLKTT